MKRLLKGLIVTALVSGCLSAEYNITSIKTSTESSDVSLIAYRRPLAITTGAFGFLNTAMPAKASRAFIFKPTTFRLPEDAQLPFGDDDNIDVIISTFNEFTGQEETRAATFTADAVRAVDSRSKNWRLVIDGSIRFEPDNLY